MDRTFTVDEARTLLAQLAPQLATFVVQRAELAELRWALDHDPASATGGVAELKAFDAHLNAIVASVRDEGVQIKGIAPLLLDFPAVRDGRDVLLCWLEGETEVGWYHRVELGFVGRRRL